MSIDLARAWIRQMVSADVDKGRENVLRAIGRKCGLGYWPIYRLSRGEAKRIDARAFERIRGAYLDFCLGQIRALEREYEAARGRKHADFEDLGAEIAALAEKVRGAKEALNRD